MQNNTYEHKNSLYQKYLFFVYFKFMNLIKLYMHAFHFNFFFNSLAIALNAFQALANQRT